MKSSASESGLRKQLDLKDTVFAFKCCMTGCVLDNLTSKLVTRGSVSGRITRNSEQLNIPLFKTPAGQRLFPYGAQVTQAL